VKAIYVGAFSAKERAGSSYENEFGPARLTPDQVEAEIARRRAKAKAIVAANQANRGKM
jgi:hypothetical protein